MSLKPLSGDPVTVQTRANALVAAAAAMAEAKTQLEHIENYGGYTSGAVKALGHKVGDLRSLVGKAHTRYHDAGEALSTYAKALKTAQAHAAAAISDYDGLQGTLAAAQASAEDKKIDPLNLDTTPADVDAAKAAHDHLTNVQGEVDAAVTAYNNARIARDHAAEKAKTAIEDANDASDLDNSRWDNFTQWVSDHTSWVPWQLIKDIADIVAIVATVAGIILSFTPLAPLGAALLVVGRIAAAISFAVTLVQFARGDIGLKELMITLAIAATGGLAKGLSKVGKLRGLLREGGVLTKAAKGAGKNLGKKLAFKDLNLVKPFKEYRTVKAERAILMEFKASVQSERSALKSLRGEDGYQDVKAIFKSEQSVYRSLRYERGVDAAKDFGFKQVDNLLKSAAMGDPKVGVPGATFHPAHGGVEMIGTKSSNIPVLGHQPIQVIHRGG